MEFQLKEIEVDELRNQSPISPLSAEIMRPTTPIFDQKEEPDEKDGYTTPTSEEYRIPSPERRKCPPAPRKRFPAVMKNRDSLSARNLSRRRSVIQRRESAVLLRMIEFEFPEILGGRRID